MHQQVDVDMGVSKKGVPQIIHFNRVFHYKPSILVVFPLFLETPISGSLEFCLILRWIFSLRIHHHDKSSPFLNNHHLGEYFPPASKKQIQQMSEDRFTRWTYQL